MTTLPQPEEGDRPAPGRRRFVRTDKVIRWLHLYTGLFLAPWMMVYAASAFCLNHGPWIQEKFEIKPPEWEVVSEDDFVVDGAFPTEPAEQATAILDHLNLDGQHRILGDPANRPMIIVRMCGSGNYRITWQEFRQRLVVEKQKPFSVLRLVHFLHLRGGYGQPYYANIAWAVIVDLVAASIVIWVLSGIYIWVRRPRKRISGGVVLAVGLALFTWLVVALCR